MLILLLLPLLECREPVVLEPVARDSPALLKGEEWLVLKIPLGVTYVKVPVDSQHLRRSCVSIVRGGGSWGTTGVGRPGGGQRRPDRSDCEPRGDRARRV